MAFLKLEDPIGRQIGNSQENSLFIQVGQFRMPANGDNKCPEGHTTVYGTQFFRDGRDPYKYIDCVPLDYKWPRD